MGRDKCLEENSGHGLKKFENHWYKQLIENA